MVPILTQFVSVIKANYVLLIKRLKYRLEAILSYHIDYQGQWSE